MSRSESRRERAATSRSLPLSTEVNCCDWTHTEVFPLALVHHVNFMHFMFAVPSPSPSRSTGGSRVPVSTTGLPVSSARPVFGSIFGCRVRRPVLALPETQDFPSVIVEKNRLGWVSLHTGPYSTLQAVRPATLRMLATGQARRRQNRSCRHT